MDAIGWVFRIIGFVADLLVDLVWFQAFDRWFGSRPPKGKWRIECEDGTRYIFDLDRRGSGTVTELPLGGPLPLLGAPELRRKQHGRYQVEGENTLRNTARITRITKERR